LAKVACSDLTARYKSGYSTVFAFIALGVSVPLDLVLIPRMGIQGAAIVSSVAYIVDAGLLLAALRHELKVSWKKLLVPTHAEFESYQQAWWRYRSWRRSVTIPAAGASGPS
jgi:Na+-driven multidrug efflux pump